MTRRFVAGLLLAAGTLLAAAAEAAVDTPYLVFDPVSGKVVAQRDPNQAWYPASLTKLMTVYVAFRELDAARLSLYSPVTVSQNALNQPPSKMGYKVGTVITVDNALKMLLVKSANDIAVALGEAISGSESAFVTRMNEEAARLGMTATRFVNPNGLPGKGQHTTARDLGILARALWLEFPTYREMFRIAAIRSGKRVLRNYNSLLERYPGANGMKTGFICSSGFNLVASATRKDDTLIAVVLGARSAAERAEDTARLLNKAFDSWGAGFMAPTIDALGGGAAAEPTPVDMRSVICERHTDEGGETEEPEEKAESVLGPRVKYMDPVTVFTGGADRKRPEPAVGVLVPRPRPVVGRQADPSAQPDNLKTSAN